jgi:hypothetical protein
MLCLPKPLADKIKKAIKSGEIDPNKMNDMTSSQRRDFLAKIVGQENAQPINLLFEKKLLLKNQERGMIEWAKEITGISKAEKEALAEKIRKTYEDKKNRVYDPKENEMFLNEIAGEAYSKKYKTDVSLEEAQTITELAQATKRARENLVEKSESGFGAAKVSLDKYVGNLKLEAQKTYFINPLKEKGTMAKIETIGADVKKTIGLIAQNSRSLVASMDNSFWGRQGLLGLVDPRTSKIWLKNFNKSWQDIGKTLKGGVKEGDAVIDATLAEIYERPNYLNGRYEMGRKLDIGTGEEAFPTTLPSKIPVFGRVFKASETAYEAGAMRMRADIADKFYAMAEKNGIDLTNKTEVGEINKVVNSITGRGSVPTGEELQKNLNNVFFSIKFFKSSYDFLVSVPKYIFSGKGEGVFARKQAAINCLNSIATVAIVLKLAQALNPNDNKDIFNPTSSNFGKIRIGNMTGDMTRGIGGLIVATSKIISQKSTSSTTGITKTLGKDYGSQTGMDVFWSFVQNKFSPLFSVLKDLATQKTFEGKKPTLATTAESLTVPIIIQNIDELKGESGAMQLIGLIADGLGISVNAYKPEADWGENTGKELNQFKEMVGDDKFKEANDLYNKRYNEWLKIIKNDPTFNSLTVEDKERKISQKKGEIKKDIFREYGFKYKAEKLPKLPK